MQETQNHKPPSTPGGTAMMAAMTPVTEGEYDPWMRQNRHSYKKPPGKLLRKSSIHGVKNMKGASKAEVYSARNESNSKSNQRKNKNSNQLQKSASRLNQAKSQNTDQLLTKTTGMEQGKPGEGIPGEVGEVESSRAKHRRERNRHAPSLPTLIAVVNPSGVITEKEGFQLQKNITQKAEKNLPLHVIVPIKVPLKLGMPKEGKMNPFLTENAEVVTSDDVDPREEYRRQLTAFHHELIQRLETSYQRNAIGLVLERPPEGQGALPLSDIRRNIRRMAALLQQQAPELFIEKRARQRLFETPPDSPSSENSGSLKDLNIDVFITDKLSGAPFPTPTETPMLLETTLPVIPQNPLSSRTDPGASLPKIPRHKLPKYDNVRSSLDTKGGSVQRNKERMEVVHRGGKPRFDHLKGSYSNQPGTTHQPNSARRFVQHDPYQPNAKSRIPPIVSESPQPPVPPRRSEIPKLPPNPERLKNLVSRDFSKPPEKRPDPRVQHLAKPMSPVKKPVDVFKMQQKVRLNQSMDNMMNMTNYGEAEKPDPYLSKARARAEEEDKDKKKPFKLPKELQRALGGTKLPPIAKAKPLTPTPPPPDPTPEPTPQLPVEESFVFIKDEFSGDEDDAPVTDSAYCTCEEFTESEDYQSLITDDGAMSSHRLEVCTNCGGKRSMRSSRVPSSIKEQSFIFGSRSSSGIFMEEEPETFPTPPPPSSPTPQPPSPGIESPVVSPEHVEVELDSEPSKPEKDFMSMLDNIGQYHGIPDPEPEVPPKTPVKRTVLAPIKRQKGNYANGVREAYIKALAAAEVARLPDDWTMMLGPRITRSWVFSYYDYVEPPKVKRPDDPPTPPPPPPPPSYLQGVEPKKKKKKKKKKFKPMKHIFGKVKPDTYFPGMKNNMILTPIEVTETPHEPVTMMAKEKLEPVKEIPPGRFRPEDYEQEEIPARNYRLNRALSRTSSCLSQRRDHSVI